MSTGTHRCSCGCHFGLKVELAYHCESSGHRPAGSTVELPELPVVVSAPAVPRFRFNSRWARPLLLVALAASLVGMDLMMEQGMAAYTQMRSAQICQVVCP